MKKDIFKLFILIMLLSCFAASTAYPAAGPRISVDTDKWNFQTVRKGEVKQKSFKIRNEGDTVLKIQNLYTCCGYRVLVLPSWEINPGSSTTMLVACDSTRKPLGRDTKYITILSNSSVNPSLKIPVTANIVKGKIGYKKEGSPENIAKIDKEASHKVPSISAPELYNRMERGYSIIILDVREESEYLHKHIQNSIRFARSRLSRNEQEFRNILTGVDKREILIVHCGGGIRSSYVTAKLKQWGYNAFNLEGGLTAWDEMGYPIVIGPKMPQSTEPLTINLEETYEHYFVIFKDKVAWIDTRDRSDYDKGHIRGAINIPLDGFEENLTAIPRDKELVLYCEGPDCESAIACARILIKNGLKQGKTKVFTGGYPSWEVAGYPVTRS